MGLSTSERSDLVATYISLFPMVPRREVEWVVAEFYGEPWGEVRGDVGQDHGTLENIQIKDLIVRQILGQLRLGVPFAYAVGNQEFLGRRFKVAPGVLIPRFETETLVAKLTERLRDYQPPAVPQNREEFTRFKNADLVRARTEAIRGHEPLGFEVGLGSGAISVSLLLEFKNLRMIATDCSETAREIALENARALGVADRLTILTVDRGVDCMVAFTEWAARRQADFLVSNPPYLDRRKQSDQGEQSELEHNVRAYEPEEALFPISGDPLQFYREIARDAVRCVRTGGLIALEIAHERAQETFGLFAGKGSDGEPDAQIEVELADDLTGRPRFLFARVGVS